MAPLACLLDLRLGASLVALSWRHALPVALSSAGLLYSSFTLAQRLLKNPSYFRIGRQSVLRVGGDPCRCRWEAEGGASSTVLRSGGLQPALDLTAVRLGRIHSAHPRLDGPA